MSLRPPRTPWYSYSPATWPSWRAYIAAHPKPVLLLKDYDQSDLILLADWTRFVVKHATILDAEIIHFLAADPEGAPGCHRLPLLYITANQSALDASGWQALRELLYAALTNPSSVHTLPPLAASPLAFSLKAADQLTGAEPDLLAAIEHVLSTVALKNIAKCLEPFFDLPNLPSPLARRLIDIMKDFNPVMVMHFLDHPELSASDLSMAVLAIPSTQTAASPSQLALVHHPIWQKDWAVRAAVCKASPNFLAYELLRSIPPADIPRFFGFLGTPAHLNYSYLLSCSPAQFQALPKPYISHALQHPDKEVRLKILAHAAKVAPAPANSSAAYPYPAPSYLPATLRPAQFIRHASPEDLRAWLRAQDPHEIGSRFSHRALRLALEYAPVLSSEYVHRAFSSLGDFVLQYLSQNTKALTQEAWLAFFEEMVSYTYTHFNTQQSMRLWDFFIEYHHLTALGPALEQGLRRLANSDMPPNIKKNYIARWLAIPGLSPALAADLTALSRQYQALAQSNPSPRR